MNLKRLTQLSGAALSEDDDRLAKRDRARETIAHLERNGFGMTSRVSEHDGVRYGLTKRFYVRGRSIEYSAGVYLTITTDHDIVGVAVVTYYERNPHTADSSGQKNRQTEYFDTVDDALAYVKRYYQESLAHEKDHLVQLARYRLSEGYVYPYLITLLSLQQLGIDWPEVGVDQVKQNKDTIVKCLLIDIREENINAYFTESIKMLREMGIAWPELDVIEQGANELVKRY